MHLAQFAGRELVLPQPAADFTLKSSDGTDFRLSRQRGDVVVLSFVYSFCPDVCPTTLVELSQVRGLLGTGAERVRFAFITLDPERDTPERFHPYVKAFDASFVALLGGAEQLAEMRKAYGVIWRKSCRMMRPEWPLKHAREVLCLRRTQAAGGLSMMPGALVSGF